MEPFQNAKAGRRYDEEFKENAVSLLKAGRSFKEVARDLGVSDGQLRVWFKRQEKGQRLSQRAALSELTPEQRENRRLRQEVEYLRRQRDILKKALAIVSEENPSGATK